MKVIDKIAWIEIKDQAILSTKSYGKDRFYIPGGKREAGETDEQTLCREILEELDVSLDKSSINFFGVFEAQAHGHQEGILVRMSCYTADYSGKLKAKSEIEEIQWLKFADKGIISEVDKLIFDDLREKNMID